MEEVIICTEQGTTFPTKIGTSMCNALIDTGATKSCISEKYYQHLPSMKIQHLKNVSVKSAMGSNLTPLGMINCCIKLGKIRFNSNLIVCRNPTRPLILGRNFLMQTHITVQYADDGKCILDYQQHELIASIDVEDKPQLNMTYSVTLPGRTLVIVCIYNNLDPNQSGYIYEIEPSSNLYEKYPNLCVIPMIHNVDVHKTEHMPMVVINFASDEIYLSKGETMGFMQIQSLDISEIMTETSTEPSPIIFEDDDKEVLDKQEGEVSKESLEKRYALTVICMLTGYVFCIPLKTKTAEEVLQVYIDNVYSKFGGSIKILSDNGTEFKNKIFEQMAKELGVVFKLYTPPYHPASYVKIEGYHAFLKAWISKHIAPQLEWDDLVTLACASYNFIPNEHSKESPFFPYVWKKSCFTSLFFIRTKNKVHGK